MKCLVEGCSKVVYCRKLCATHYKRQWRHGSVDVNNSNHRYSVGEVCGVDGCVALARDLGYCKTHAARVRRHNHTDLVRRANGTGAINTAGYRLITVNGVRVYEHIHVAEKALGRPLPAGAVVHHMNEMPADNHTPFNLIICPDQAYHMLLHKRMRQLAYPRRD